MDDRTLLITDAVSTDGRFLLHTLALQYLSSRYSFDSSESIDGDNKSSTVEGAVLWISCAPVAEKQIMMGLRKGLQHNLGGGNTTGPASGWTGGKSSGSSSFSQGGIGNSSGRIHIVSMPMELADAALEQQENASSFSHEEYLKKLYKRIVHWLNHRELLPMQQSQQKQEKNATSSSLGPNLIIIDSATTLGTLFGDGLANAFLSSVRSAMKKHSNKRCSLVSSSNTATANATTQTAGTINTCSATITNLLAIRASSPDDGGLYQIEDDGNMKGEKLRSEYARLLRPWLGFGSGSSLNNDGGGAGTNVLQMEEQSNYLSLSPNSSVPSLLFRSGFYEVADGIVDVSPLESGYARDVLGRLSFTTTWNGKGWWGIAGTGNSVSAGSAHVGGIGGNMNSSGNATKKEEIIGAYTSICVNYRCDDSGARVMRLRSR